MAITITTPTGHIGSALTEILLSQGQKVTIIARDKSRVAHFAKRGATVIEGSHRDEKTVLKATVGAEAFFVLIPPDLKVTDIRSYYRSFGNAAAAAIRTNKIPRVVHLSSVGADQEAGSGPVIGLHDTEAILADAAPNIAQLRAGYFMENSLWQIGSIKGAGQMYTTFQGDTLIPMIATSDIAERAATLLTSQNWKGQRIVELQGAADISYNQVAAILAETLKREVTHVTITPSQSKEAFVGMGASAHMADLFNELAAGVSSGKVCFREKRNADNSTPTTYSKFADTVFKGAYNAS